MTERRTVLLLHRQSSGHHYDWMLEDPTAPPGAGRLITFGMGSPVDQWPTERVVGATRLADHRRAYLEYEGPLTRGRGQVERVEEGVFRTRLWLRGRFVADLHMGGLKAMVEAAHVAGQRWQVRVVGGWA